MSAKLFRAIDQSRGKLPPSPSQRDSLRSILPGYSGDLYANKIIRSILVSTSDNKQDTEYEYSHFKGIKIKDFFLHPFLTMQG